MTLKSLNGQQKHKIVDNTVRLYDYLDMSLHMECWQYRIHSHWLCMRIGFIWPTGLDWLWCEWTSLPVASPLRISTTILTEDICRWPSQRFIDPGSQHVSKSTVIHYRKIVQKSCIDFIFNTDSTGVHRVRNDPELSIPSPSLSFHIFIPWIFRPFTLTDFGAGKKQSAKFLINSVVQKTRSRWKLDSALSKTDRLKSYQSFFGRWFSSYRTQKQLLSDCFQSLSATSIHPI